MAFDTKGLDDYVDVAQRIADFRERCPEGSLEPLNPKAPFEIREVTGVDKAGKEFTATFIIYIAAAYRTPDDKRPGIGMAWEVFPGRTSFTLGSELMNAETSAWGRAIIAALKSDSKRGVASREEIRNRAAEHDDTPPSGKAPPPPRKPRRPAADPVHSKTTGADHERLRHGTVEATPDDRQAARTRGPVPDDQNPWQADAPPNGRNRLGAIGIHFDRLGVTDRSIRLGYVAAITGHAVTSSKELTDDEQTSLLEQLSRCKNLAALEQLSKQEAST